MGSIPSTPNGDSRENDPWFPIEQQNFELERSPLIQSNMEQQQGHNLDDQNNCAPINKNQSEIDENCENSQVNSDIEQNPSVSGNSISESTITNDRSHGQTIDEFEIELKVKRERRLNAVSVLRNELLSLRSQLAEQKEINRMLQTDLNEERKSNKEHGKQKDNDESNSTIGKKRSSINCTDFDNQITISEEDYEEDMYVHRSADIALKSELSKLQLQLQLANSEVLSLSAELNATRKQVGILKDVVKVTKDMVAIRDEHLTELKGKLKEIEDSLATRELKIMSDNLRQEYDRQLASIRNLRTLYEERARVNAAERENLIRQLDTKRTEFDAEVEKNRILDERVTELEKDLDNKTNDLINTKDELIKYKLESCELKEEMTAINELFSQLLVGFSGGNDIDIDKLTSMLEDNRDLINDITNRENSKEKAAALPKLIFDLVTQSKDDKENVINNVDEATTTFELNTEQQLPVRPCVTSAQEIIHNLPKVWKVLNELLNHQIAEKVDFKENGQSEECYKSVQTPTGPQLVLSVSKTYIRLKDLILEKKFLQKETQKLKNLNTHLESRLNTQEGRLSAVSIELNKTWSLVGRMQRQHRQLHTHEQVLRYQLQQKRRMLNELKDELEYCRRKWALARAKNDESQTQWNSLRLEFSKRKKENSNSAESGYSDDPLSDEDNSDVDALHLENIQSIKTELTSTLCAKSTRTQSVSPTRNTSTLTVVRRNSAPSQINQSPAQMLTSAEEYQILSEIVPVKIESEIIDTKLMVNTDLIYAASASIVPIENEDIKSVKKEIKLEEPKVQVACSSTNKFVKASTVKPNEQSKTKMTRQTSLNKPSKALAMVPRDTGARPKLCREVRDTSKRTPKTSECEESLEDMFYRLSGIEPPSEEKSNQSEIQEDTSDDDDDRRAIRSVRYQKLEQQCQQLISKVINSTTNVELDEEHKQILNETGIVPETSNLSVSITEDDTKMHCDQVSSETDSIVDEPQIKTDEECLTVEEQEYTQRRAARLQRLEEECQAFLDRANERKATAIDLNKKVDNLHKRFGNDSTEKLQVASSTTENEDCLNYNTTSASAKPNNDDKVTDEDCLSDNTASAAPSLENDCTEDNSQAASPSTEDVYLERRAERLLRLEAESADFLERLTESTSRVNTIDSQLDKLHEKYGKPNKECTATNSTTAQCENTAQGASAHTQNNTEISSEDNKNISSSTLRSTESPENANGTRNDTETLHNTDLK